MTFAAAPSDLPRLAAEVALEATHDRARTRRRDRTERGPASST